LAVVDAQSTVRPHEAAEFMINMNRMHLFDHETEEVFACQI
jgi:hypothetical protein